MKLAVLGASGVLGKLVCTDLAARGHEVLPISRKNGVDASNGESLSTALAGVDVLIDCINHAVASAKKAVPLFTETTQNAVAAAEANNIGRVVCITIAGANDPVVGRGYGYYQGKAIQEQIYRNSSLDVAFVHSTQWYELIGTLIDSTTLGPLAVPPKLLMAPIPAAVAAQLVCDIAVGDVHVPDSGTISIRGAEQGQLSDFARRILKASGKVGTKNPRWFIALPYIGKAIATGALVPEPADRTDNTTVEQWLAAQ